MRKLLVLSFLFLAVALIAQPTTFPKNGVYDKRQGKYAFTNAKIYQSPTKVIENATLVIKDGKVVSVGVLANVPKDAVEIDCSGKTIYPSFIETFTQYGLTAQKRAGGHNHGAQVQSKKDGAYGWNEAMKSDYEAAEDFKPDSKEAETMRALGFGVAASHRMDGMCRGSGSVVVLGDEVAQEAFILEESAHYMSFNKGTSKQSFPSSLMGGISLFKQTYHDAKWYLQVGNKEQLNLSLEDWSDLQDMPQIFEVRDWLEALRADKIAKEFGKKYIFKGGGDEYRRIAELKQTGASFIIPVNFPAAYDVSDPYDALQASLDDMKHWELAPANAARLAEAGIPFAFTTHGLKDKKTFLKQIKKAIEAGLSEADALAALTTSPAALMNIQGTTGTLEAGKMANFFIADGSVFEGKTKIYQHWVKGKGYIIKSMEAKDFAGHYDLRFGKTKGILWLEGDEGKRKAYFAPAFEGKDSTKTEAKFVFNRNQITLSFNPEKGNNDLVALAGTGDEKSGFSGKGTLANGDWVEWTAQPISPKTETTDDAEKKKDKKDETKKEDKPGEVIFPFIAYGHKASETPKQETYLIQNATVWTNEAEGNLAEADVLVMEGKIKKVGKDLGVPKNAVIIDGTGKHLTTGIIDEHSHIAISRGVNEGTQASSAEVSIADVVNSEDVNIYRQLAGGVTAAQLLHGSANPIGGQSAAVKFRWGKTPEEMKIIGADPFIKFALGENVKQSNWGDNYQSRFPQSRMGVEQVFEDHFTRASEYLLKKASGQPYRKDLELETLGQILNKDRFITCHSYVQSEINMLMKVADKYDFTLNTFTHILEGYKVADKMKEHGAGGSTFSDWWAYKYEVIDAIPYNAAILIEEGVTTALNSDDAEMARRLNQEAAKTVMYGDVEEIVAWKTVTLNPAILLHLDDRMGSIKQGKDADLVLWSDNPLSIYARAEATWVDGVKYFDLEQDQKKREEIKRERARLIQKMQNHKKKGGKTQPVKPKNKHHYHCDDIHDEMAH